MMDTAVLLREFITLFTVIDPVGSIPVYMYAVRKVPKHLHKQYAIRAVLIASCVLYAFMIFGQVVLETLGLNFGSFKIAGGIVLFIFALSMIFGDSKPSSEIAEAQCDPLEGAVFPLAIPSIASPGAMLAIVVLTDNHSHNITEQVITGALLGVILLFTLLLLFAANFINKFIGNTGASVISRVMGILLATIAVDAILNGFITLGILDI